MFWKKKPVTFKFVTCNKKAYEYAKPDRATKFLPTWWKDLAKEHKKNQSVDMTNCNGFLDLYKQSMIVPLWSGLTLNIGGEGTEYYDWEYSDSVSLAAEHPPMQRGGLFPADKHQHLKLTSPWLLVCDEEIDVSWQQPTYSNPVNGIIALSGITRPKHMPAVNINLMFERNDTRYLLDVGYPLMHLIPLTEREFKVEHELVSFDEFEKMQPLLIPSLYGRYSKTLKHKAKCPFGV